MDAFGTYGGGEGGGGVAHEITGLSPRPTIAEYSW